MAIHHSTRKGVERTCLKHCLLGVNVMRSFRSFISIEFEQGVDWLQQVAPLSMRHFRIETQKKNSQNPKAEVKTVNEPRTKTFYLFIILNCLLNRYPYTCYIVNTRIIGYSNPLYTSIYTLNKPGPFCVTTQIWKAQKMLKSHPSGRFLPGTNSPHDTSPLLSLERQRSQLLEQHQIGLQPWIRSCWKIISKKMITHPWQSP